MDLEPRAGRCKPAILTAFVVPLPALRRQDRPPQVAPSARASLLLPLMALLRSETVPCGLEIAPHQAPGCKLLHDVKEYQRAACAAGLAVKPPKLGCGCQANPKTGSRKLKKQEA